MREAKMNQREEFIQKKEAELKELEKENMANSPQLEMCPFCGSAPTVESTGIFCDYEGCYVQPSVYCEMPEFLPQLWNAMAKGVDDEGEISSDRKKTCNGCDCEKECTDDEKFHQPELNPCYECGFPPKRRNVPGLALVLCPECLRSSVGNDITEAVDQWNEKNPLKVEPFPFNSIEQSPEITDTQEIQSIVTKKGDGGITKASGIWINKRPDEQPLMLLNKLDLLNAVLGLQRDGVGPVIKTKEIQESIIEIVKSIQERTCWENNEAIQNLEESIKEMESCPYLGPDEKEYVKVRGTVYVTALHIARAICREAELYAWEWKQRKDIRISLIPKYLNRLGDWFFIMAEYLRETEECF